MSDTDTLGRITAVMAREDALDLLVRACRMFPTRPPQPWTPSPPLPDTSTSWPCSPASNYRTPKGNPMPTDIPIPYALTADNEPIPYTVTEQDN